MKPKIIASVSERIKTAMEIRHISQADICRKTGIDKGSVSSYVSGRYEPKDDRIFLIANALQVNPSWLSGFDTEMDIYPSRLKSPSVTDDYTTFPVIGEIAAGYNNIAIEDWSGDTIDIPNRYLKGRKVSDFLVLKVKGDSMYPIYQEGDTVLVLKQTTVNNSGDIGAVIYDNEYATLKKIEFVYGEDWLKLIPLNPEFKPKTIEGADLEKCRVIGIPKLLIREI